MINSALALIVGVAIVCFLLLYLASAIDGKKHFILQLLIVFFVISAILIIPKAGVDALTSCEPVMNNSIVTSNTTQYTYVQFCITRSEGTANSFLNLTQKMYYIMLGYAIVFLAITSLIHLRDSVVRKKGKGR